MRNPKYSRSQWERAEFCSNVCRGATIAVPRALCGCGCGQVVAKPRSKYKQGHNPVPASRYRVFQQNSSGGKTRWWVPSREGKRIAWARIVMWDQIGREPTAREVVHHVNGNSEDDRPENLELFASHSEHMRHEQALGRVNTLRGNPHRTRVQTTS